MKGRYAETPIVYFETHNDIPAFSEFEDEMDKINNEIDNYIEQARQENEAFMKELEMADSPKFEIPELEAFFKN